jgi:hypothetical protein
MKNRQILEGHVKFGFSLVVENMKLNCHYFEKKLHNCEFIIHPNITVFAKIIHIPYSLFFIELGRYRNFRYRYRYSDTSFQIPILQINASEILFHLVFTSQCKYHVKTIILELD